VDSFKVREEAAAMAGALDEDSDSAPGADGIADFDRDLMRHVLGVAQGNVNYDYPLFATDMKSKTIRWQTIGLLGRYEKKGDKWKHARLAGAIRFLYPKGEGVPKDFRFLFPELPEPEKKKKGGQGNKGKGGDGQGKQGQGKQGKGQQGPQGPGKQDQAGPSQTKPAQASTSHAKPAQAAAGPSHTSDSPSRKPKPSGSSGPLV
jgi:hypothetical protein